MTIFCSLKRMKGYLDRPHTSSGWGRQGVLAAKIPRVTPHELGHDAASFAVSAGAIVKAIQKMLGHMHPQRSRSMPAPTCLTMILRCLRRRSTKGRACGVVRIWAKDETQIADQA
ncbi:site-specific recombinase XerD [Rhodococcus erythropolis CCM2595]|nr:site-specific recombinase XerD [Rhodococcus erythropolis CCM2595]